MIHNGFFIFFTAFINKNKTFAPLFIFAPTRLCLRMCSSNSSLSLTRVNIFYPSLAFDFVVGFFSFVFSRRERAVCLCREASAHSRRKVGSGHAKKSIFFAVFFSPRLFFFFLPLLFLLLLRVNS